MRPLPSSCVRIGYEERKGVLLCMEDAILMEADTVRWIREPERASYGGSTFVLIVVLFILLIIVGRSFCV